MNGGGGSGPPHEPELDPAVLLSVYRQGAFPMDVGDPALPVGFYETDPRGIMPIEGFRIPRSVARGLRRWRDEVRVDSAFAEVAHACGGDRDGEWLTPRLVRAYVRLHEHGWAHSVEVWREGRLVGGLFGMALGGLFTSETMFHRAPDAGNAALVATARLLGAGGFTLWDIQMVSAHTARFGAYEISGANYRRRLGRALRVHARLGG